MGTESPVCTGWGCLEIINFSSPSLTQDAILLRIISFISLFSFVFLPRLMSHHLNTHMHSQAKQLWYLCGFILAAAVVFVCFSGNVLKSSFGRDSNETICEIVCNNLLYQKAIKHEKRLLRLSEVCVCRGRARRKCNKMIITPESICDVICRIWLAQLTGIWTWVIAPIAPITILLLLSTADCPPTADELHAGFPSTSSCSINQILIRIYHWFMGLLAGIKSWIL